MRRGISLIELLVVLGIVGILATLLLPGVMQAREAARRVQCKNRLKQIGLALHNYHDQYAVFPPGIRNEWSWIAATLPHLEHGAIFNSFDFHVEPFEAPNDTQADFVLSVLHCPSDPRSDAVYTAPSLLGDMRFAHTNFLGTERTFSGTVRGMFGYNSTLRFADVVDGTSQTLFVGERPVIEAGGQTFGWWVWGSNLATVLSATEGIRRGDANDANSATHYWSYHDGGAHFLFVDGSVHFLPYSIDADSFVGLGTTDGSEVVGVY